MAKFEANDLNRTFMKKHDEIEKDIKYLHSQNSYIANMDILLKKYQNSNKQLKKETDKNKKTVQTSSRLSFYYDDDIDTINDWISALSFIYWVIFVSVIIKFIVLDVNFTDLYLWMAIGFFAIFPFIVFPIHKWLKTTVKSVNMV